MWQRASHPKCLLSRLPWFLESPPLSTASVRYIQWCCYCSVAESCPTLYNPMVYNTLGSSVLHHLPGLAQTHVHWVSDVIQLSHPLLSPYPLAFSLSQHQGLSNESAIHITWPKHWSFNFNISPPNEYSGLISFRIHWFGLLEVWGTLKSLLPNHTSQASVLQLSTFFMVHLSHPYMTIGKTIALTIGTSVGKVMSLLFNMLSRRRW